MAREFRIRVETPLSYRERVRYYGVSLPTQGSEFEIAWTPDLDEAIADVEAFIAALHGAVARLRALPTEETS